MNNLYIALPLFAVFVWVIAVIVVRHDKKVRDANTHTRKRTAR
jgi:type IV secretory pathway VirB3-like protein